MSNPSHQTSESADLKTVLVAWLRLHEPDNNYSNVSCLKWRENHDPARYLITSWYTVCLGLFSDSYILIEVRAVCVSSCLPALSIGKQWEAHRTFVFFHLLTSHEQILQKSYISWAEQSFESRVANIWG